MLVQRSPFFLCALVLSMEFSRGGDEPVLDKGPPPEEESQTSEGEDQDCPVCMWRKHSKEMRLESIKSQILSKLRLKEAPNITREVVNQLLPKAPPLQQILDLHDFQGDSFPQDDFLEEDEYHATTETVISMAQETDQVVQIEGSPHCCFFNFSPKVMFTKVLKAQLWVYLRPIQHTTTVYLQILRLKPVTEEGSRHIRIRSLKIDLNSRIGHWQSIDFKHVLQNWFKQPQNNWGIEINAFDHNGNDLAVTSFGPGAEGLDTGCRHTRLKSVAGLSGVLRFSLPAFNIWYPRLMSHEKSELWKFRKRSERIATIALKMDSVVIRNALAIV